MSISTKEILLRPRQPLVSDSYKNWPLPIKDCKYTLSLHDNVNKNLKALDEARERTEIDFLMLELNHLSHEEIRDKLKEIFETNDRVWSVELMYDVPTSPRQLIGEGALQNMLQVLRLVRNLRLNITTMHTVENHRFLQCLPRFQQLGCLDLQICPCDQYDIEHILDLPAAPQMSGIQFEPDMSRGEPVMSRNASKRLRALHLNMMFLSVGHVSTVVNVLSTLPALQRLDIGMPHRTQEYMTPLSTLFEWLKSDRCMVTEVSFLMRNRDQLPLILSVISQMPKLETVRLSGFRLSPNIDAFLQMLRDSPSLRFLHLSYCEFDQRSASKLLQFQLECRPRLLTLQLDDATQNYFPAQRKFYQIAKIHQCLQKLENSRKRQSFPLSAWPFVMEKMGQALSCPSAIVNGVGADAIFNLLLRLLSDPHSLDPRESKPDMIKKRKDSSPRRGRPRNSVGESLERKRPRLEDTVS